VKLLNAVIGMMSLLIYELYGEAILCETGSYPVVPQRSNARVERPADALSSAWSVQHGGRA
jgi:hypothetical protein